VCYKHINAPTPCAGAAKYGNLLLNRPRGGAMRLQKASTLGLIGSFAIGAMVTLGVMNNYQAPHEPASTTVNTVGDDSSASATPTPTPTESMSPGDSITDTPTAVEGDDGSLGGPVYTAPSQTEPVYVFPTTDSATASTDDETSTPSESDTPVTHTTMPTPSQSMPEPIGTASPDDRVETP